jgi:hypothetical protein
MAPPRPIAAALAAAGAWLLEPARPKPAQALTAPPVLRPVVAVFGLARGCGTTVVARALGAELARRDAFGAAAVHCDARPAGIPLATPAASRLAAALADVTGVSARASGRLCLIGGASGEDPAVVVDAARHVAPLVLDAGAASLGGAAAALADEVVVVAAPSVEPSLAAVAADCLDREPVVVLNRAAAPPEIGRWSGRIVYPLPQSRMGAQLALSGREPRGALGEAVAELADRIEGRGP